MPNLKNNFFIFIIFLLTGCASKDVFELSSFDTKSSPKELHVVGVTSDRVKQECLFLDAEAENNWRHQYIMYILNKDNEVIPVMHAIHQEKSICLEQFKNVEKILLQDSIIKICLRDKLKKDLTNSEMQDFGLLGKHPVTFESLTFDSICSSKNCFNANKAWSENCPGFKKF